MEKFIRFYNQNRKKIYKWITIIAVSYLFLRIINSIIEEKSRQNILAYMENSINNNNVVNEVVLNNTTSSTNTKEEKYGNVLDDFLDYCKTSSNYEKAYEMLSEETKDKYDTKEKFINNFINIFFNNNSEYLINELKNVYVIEIYANNILETGNTDEIKRQYIKIQDKKIIIQDYIRNEDINKKQTNNDIIFNIKNVTYYYDYAQYKVYVTNSSANTINIQNTYLQLNNTKLNGQAQNQNLQLKPYESKILDLKFDIRYKEINTIKNMTIETDNGKIEIEL